MKEVIRKYDLRFLTVIIVTLGLYALIVNFFIGIRTISGLTFYFSIFGIFTFLALSSDFTLYEVAERLSFKKADRRELEKEDDLLLQAVGFSQTVLFIYLNLVPSTAVIDFFKWIVPVEAMVFYLLRGYAKVKNTVRYRYYSITALIFINASTLGSVLAIGAPPLFVDGIDVKYYLMVPIYVSFLEAPRGFFEVFCRKRYGYPK